MQNIHITIEPPTYTNEYINERVIKFLQTGVKLPFIEYYSHNEGECYKILNPYTKYSQEKVVLCSIREGFMKALEKAFPIAQKWWENEIAEALEEYK